MTLIQPILLVAIGASFVLYLSFFRSQLKDRFIALLLAAVAGAIILFPDVTTVVANWVGVNRGTDLMLYAFISFALFVGVLMFSRIARLERQQTQLVRKLALDQARSASGHRQPPPSAW